MNKKKKFIVGILSEDRSIAAAMLTALAQNYGWDVGIEFIPPSSDAEYVRNCIKVSKPDLFGLSFKS